MIAKIKAKYKNGVLTPLEPLDLEDGAEVSVTIEKRDKQNQDAGASSKFENRASEAADMEEGALSGMLRLIEEMHKEIPPEAWDVLPRDLAKNKKHYLYGRPKEED